MNQVATRADAGSIAEAVIAKGDLAKLTEAQRTQYYVAVCESVGLNPLTTPFAYITLNGKLTLYALRNATDQLRAIYKVSVAELTNAERDGVYIVTAKVQNAEGRTDIATGAVTINGLKGDALANAIMKSETKAKRRATLSICGLGMLDETEVETIPGAEKPRVRDGSNGAPKSSRQAKLSGDWDFVGEIKAITTEADLVAWREKNAATIASFPPQWLASFEEEVYEPKLEELRKPVETLSDRDSALLLKSLIALANRCETKTQLRTLVRDKDTKTNIGQLVEADYLKFSDLYEAQLGELPE